VRGVGYIFSEFFFEYINIYCNILLSIEIISNIIINTIAMFLPYFVKYAIGYCNFYYQLGYGIIFYIYFFRRYKAKKKKITTFYGNSISNWILFNGVIFKNFLFKQPFVSYILTHLKIGKNSFKYAFSTKLRNKQITHQFFNRIFVFFKNSFLYIWTPIFKKSSYISFVNLLKRFNKRK
jgi:hypothetical protein